MTYYRLGVLGDPVEHSRSPQLHATMLRLAGLEGEYLRVLADEQVLQEAIDGLRRGEWDGLNVTMPLKEAAARLVDTLTPVAERSGSVNTLIRSDSAVQGDSTDTAAFRILIDSARFAGRSSLLILGAGGSAAAALAALEDTSNTYVASRRIASAEELTSRLGGEVVSWGTAVARALIINATPLGMTGEKLPDGILEIAAGLIDLAYASDPTPAIDLADRHGIPRADGHEFLLRQAMVSFHQWTGVRVDYDAITVALRNI
jgi:shikimate dehydrogenase